MTQPPNWFGRWPPAFTPQPPSPRVAVVFSTPSRCVFHRAAARAICGPGYRAQWMCVFVYEVDTETEPASDRLPRDIADAALSVADLILIPTRAEALDIRAMTQTVRLAKQMGKRPSVVLTFSPPTGAEIEQAREIVAQLEADLVPVSMHLRKA